MSTTDARDVGADPRIEVHTEVNTRTLTGTVDADPNHAISLELVRYNNGPWRARILTRTLDPHPGRSNRADSVWQRDLLTWIRVDDATSRRPIPGPPPPLWLARWADGVQAWQNRLAEEIGR